MQIRDHAAALLANLRDGVRAPSRGLQAAYLATAALGVLVLLVNTVTPFLGGSGGDDGGGLIADPSAGGGQPADQGFVWVNASAYGGEFVGQETACGQVLEPTSRIVAHRDLACGTELVIRLGEDSVAATVADRGPFEDGRELDLAPGVWQALGFASIDGFGVRGVQVRLIE